MDEISDRASIARWEWKAKRARTAISAAFVDHGHQLVGEWCDSEKSTTLSETSARLGSSPSRVIQRWPTKQHFIEVVGSCGQTLSQFEYVYVIIMDAPDAAWIRVSADLIPSGLAAAAGEWMTDGFIALDPGTESLLSVDVEEKHGLSVIETTVIGDGFSEFRSCFKERGPLPLRITDPS